MTTGATGQLGLALPVQGELSGTWGDTVNNGITQYTNLAIAATLTLTNDGAVTLANTTGDASATNITSSLTGAGTVTAQFAIVKITGTLTTTKVVTGPSYSKTYVVVNAATGGTVTFKASGQTGVSIAVGESAYVYYNGTDYVKIVGTATAGAAGGSNTQVQYNSSGSLAGSANLTFDGTSVTASQFLSNGFTLADNTDITKKALFNLSGITTATTRTLTVPNADGTLALLSGTQTFSGSTTFSSTFTLSGTTSAISLGSSQSSGTMTIGGTSGTGTITLGRSTGSQTTNIQAGATASGSTKTINFGTAGLSGSTTNINIGSAVSGATSTITTNGTPIWSFEGSEQMRLTSTGLGIGTTSPGGKLDVRAGTGATLLVAADATNLVSLNNYNSTSGFQDLKYAGSTHQFFTGTAGGGSVAERARIDSVGYLSGVWADKVTALGNTGTATTITCTSGNVFTATLTGNCTFTLSAPSTTTANTATSFTLILTNDGTAGRTVAFSGGTFKYPGGSVTRTTTANAIDIWFFFSPDGGTTWYVSIPMANLS